MKTQATKDLFLVLTPKVRKPRYPACWRGSVILPSGLLKLLVFRDGTMPYHMGTAASVNHPVSARLLQATITRRMYGKDPPLSIAQRVFVTVTD